MALVRISSKQLYRVTRVCVCVCVCLFVCVCVCFKHVMEWRSIFDEIAEFECWPRVGTWRSVTESKVR